MSDLQLIPGSLPSDLECYQTLYDEMFSRGHAVGDNITGILIQDLPPDPIDHDKGWIPTSADVPIYPGYIFTWHPVYSKWVSRHYIGPEDIKRYPVPYVGVLADFITYLQTYDGGDIGAPGVASGPMWEVDSQFAGSVPVGVGLIPGSSPAASIVQGGDTQDSLGNSGEYKHTLTEAEGAVGNHVHPMGNGDPGTGDVGLNYETPAVTTPAFTEFGNTGGGPIGIPVTEANLITLKANDGNGVVSNGHNNMMPYVGVYFIKRTAREFYVAA